MHGSEAGLLAVAAPGEIDGAAWDGPRGAGRRSVAVQAGEARVPRRLHDAAGLRLRAHLLDAVGVAVVAAGRDGRVIYVNPLAEELYACSAGDALGRVVADVVSWDLPDEVVEGLMSCAGSTATWTGDVALRDPGVEVAVSITPLAVDGEVVAMVASAADATERNRARASLLHQSLHDDGTGLLNRRGLVAGTAQLIEAHDFGAAPVDTIRIEVHELRMVSDAFGWAEAARVVAQLARSITGAAHRGDLVGRISASSFGVCCPHDLEPEGAVAYAERLVEVVAQPQAIGTSNLDLHASAGIATAGHAGVGVEELFQQADIALTHVRRQGRGGTCHYDPSLRLPIIRQLELEAVIRRAVALGEVALGYQPVVRLADQRVVGAEALLRMVDADGEPIPAFELATAAERSGLIGDLGLLVLQTACRQAARWQRPGADPVGVAVNVSALQLQDPRLAHQVDDALAAAGLDPARLTLEMTETVLMADTDRTARQLARLKMSGVRLAADDFGTGYSSLAYLKRFPLDAIKADLSFVAGLPDSPEDVAVVSAMVAMADALGLTVVAEGVETERQLQALEALGSTYGQGYLWSRAIPGEEVAAVIDRLDVAARSAAAHPGAAPSARQVAMPAADDLEAAFRSFSHEVEAPLAIVRGWADVLAGATGQPVGTAGTDLRRATQRIERVLAGLGTALALEEGRLDLAATTFDLAALVDEVLVEVDPQLRARVTVHRYRGTPPVVFADRLQIAHVITSLVRNAGTWAPLGSRIQLAVVAEPGGFAVRVEDEGPGLSEDEVAVVFRKYGWVARAGDGADMGLYLARGIARAHGGDVSCEPRSPAPGSRFSLHLPGSPAPAATEASRAAADRSLDIARRADGSLT